MNKKRIIKKIGVIITVVVLLFSFVCNNIKGNCANQYYFYIDNNENYDYFVFTIHEPTNTYLNWTDTNGEHRIRVINNNNNTFDLILYEKDNSSSEWTTTILWNDKAYDEAYFICAIFQKYQNDLTCQLLHYYPTYENETIVYKLVPITDTFNRSGNGLSAFVVNSFCFNYHVTLQQRVTGDNALNTYLQSKSIRNLESYYYQRGVYNQLTPEEVEKEYQNNLTLWIRSIFGGINEFFNIHLGAVTIGSIILIPLSISVAWFIIRSFKGGGGD